MMNILNLSERKRHILSTLYYSNGYVTGQKIASLMDVSSRTIRSEIKSINIEFGKEVVKSNHQGYLLADDSLFENIRNNGFNSEKRRDDLILMTLLSEKEARDLDEFSESIYMSKTTTLNELRKIVLPEGLKINKRNNSASIEGPELLKRKLINQIIHRGLTKSFVCIDDVCEYFHHPKEKNIFEILMDVTHKKGFHISNVYQINVMIDIEIALSRMSAGFDGKKDPEIEIDDELMSISTSFCRKIAPLTNLKFSKRDIQNIAHVLIGKIEPLSDLPPDPELRKKMQKLVDSTFKFYCLDIDFHKYLDRFTLHIQKLLARCHNNNQAETAMNYNIRFRCPFIYEVSVHLAGLLQKEFGIILNVSEISLNAVFLGKAMTREREYDDIIDAVLLSNNYQDTRDYILERINRDFKDQIKIKKVITSYDELKKVGRFDLLITTIPQYLFNCDYTRITYLYTIDDKIRLHNSISKVMEKKKNENVRKSLSNIFDKKLFFKNTKLNNMDEAVAFLNEQLTQQDIVDKSFVESLYKREELSSTVIDGVFAFPHTLSLNEKKTKCAVLINEKGFIWGNYRIPFIFLFCINKKDIAFFEEMYNNLTKILLFNDNYNRIFDMNSYEEFIDYINEKLKYIY